MSKYVRTLAEVKDKAVLHWPPELLEKAAEASVLPLLLSTQDKFISVLTLADAEPEAWRKFIDLSIDMKANIFLKHLMILSDLAGEALKKYPPFSQYFKGGQMQYVWREKTYIYDFKAISERVTLDNKALKVDGKSLLKGYELTPKMEDVIMLLLVQLECQSIL